MPETDLKFAPDGPELRALQAGEQSKRRGAIFQHSSVPLPALFRDILSSYSFSHLEGLIDLGKAGGNSFYPGRKIS